MIVLSAFDGMSCGRVALERIGITPSIYFASEIDKYAIQISKKNYPDICHVGDIRKVHELNLPRPYLLIGGSPCQGFSFAGKQLNFNDPRSVLFFEFNGLRNMFLPEYFLLENVMMTKESRDVITRFLGVEPIEISSSLVSAQNRRRLYWTNIPGVTQPEDKGLLLRDILETDGSGAIKNRGVYYERNDKSMCLDANYHKGVDNHGQRTMVYLTDSQVESAIRSHSGKVWKTGNRMGKAPFPSSVDRKAKCLVSRQRIGNRATTHICENGKYRMLTPVEFERLQTLPDNYTEGVSNTQRYKMIGNGWTIDVISHILSFLPLPQIQIPAI